MGGNISAHSIGRVTVLGDAKNLNMDLTRAPGGRSLDALYVQGSLVDSHINAAGRIGTVDVGSMSGSTIASGVRAGVGSLATTATDCDALSSISVRSVGRTGPGTTENSTILSRSINRVMLNDGAKPKSYNDPATIRQLGESLDVQIV